MKLKIFELNVFSNRGREVAMPCLYLMTFVFVIPWPVVGAETQNESLQETVDSRIHERDLFCGPRCLQIVFACFDRDSPSLYDLVAEVQPVVDEGSSLLALEKALTRRGIHTKALSVRRGHSLNWPYPVIIHSSGRTAGGHYIVWCPSKSEERHLVWTPETGWLEGKWETLVGREVDAVLLTAPEPITNYRSALELDELPIKQTIICSFILWSIISIVYIVKARLRKSA